MLITVLLLILVNTSEPEMICLQRCWQLVNLLDVTGEIYWKPIVWTHRIISCLLSAHKAVWQNVKITIRVVQNIGENYDFKSKHQSNQIRKFPRIHHLSIFLI